MEPFVDDAGRVEVYQVKLPIFEGPLDLLLHLIQKNELDITAISLALVADQFVEHMQSLQAVQAGVIAEFLLMAAKLLLIKSRLLLPKPPVSSDEEEEDPGEALARRLREYKRFKDAALHLRTREAARQRCHVRVASPPPMETRIDWESISIDDLIASVRRLLERELDVQPVDPLVSPRKITVREKIERIEELLRNGEPVSFGLVVGDVASRVDIVVSLWAVLELIKRGHLAARQPELFGEIMLMHPVLAGREM